MDCERAREELHDLWRGRLEAAPAAEVQDHLDSCAECRKEAEAEALLDRALLERLPRPPASPALRRQVAELWARRGEAPAARPLRARRLLLPALAFCLALLSGALLLERRARTGGDGVELLSAELVSDHLRQLASAHPLDLESGVNHEVKPWFEGRLDFAPAVPPDAGDLRLLGGSLGYVLERKAAVISYAVRRHRVTLLAFPAAGLAWPSPDRTLGGIPASVLARRGFSVVLWRSGELGYALVSDLGGEDGERVAAGLAAATAR
jgi:anti-sigma factor RsiW